MGVYGYSLYSLMTHNGYDRHGKELWNLQAQFGNYKEAVCALRLHNRRRKLEGTLSHPAAQMFRFVSTRRVS